MKLSSKMIWSVATLLSVAACSSQKEEKAAQQTAEAVPTIQQMMTTKIDVDADAIWAIGNAAIDDKASIDAAKMSDKMWQELGAAATRMSGDAHRLGALDPIVVTQPGVQIADEGTPGAPSPAEIQQHLRRDTDTYRALAESLATHAADLATAARARDAVNAGRLINELDGVCESCHLEFWYPEQKALVESLQKQAGDPAR